MAKGVFLSPLTLFQCIDCNPATFMVASEPLTYGTFIHSTFHTTTILFILSCILSSFLKFYSKEMEYEFIYTFCDSRGNFGEDHHVVGQLGENSSLIRKKKKNKNIFFFLSINVIMVLNVLLFSDTPTH